MIGRRRRQTDRTAAVSPLLRAQSALVTDVEAYVAGALVEVRRATGAPVPPWAWTNLLAHGTWDELTAVAGERVRGADREWRRARAVLTVAVLDAAGDPQGLDRVQHQVLMPVESVLSTVHQPTLTPSHVVSRVLYALATAPAPQRDPEPRRAGPDDTR